MALAMAMALVMAMVMTLAMAMAMVMTLALAMGMAMALAMAMIDKKEAIKWVKELDKVNKKNTLELSKFTSYGVDSKTNTNVVRWIKHFFNITEEELKKLKEKNNLLKIS